MMAAKYDLVLTNELLKKFEEIVSDCNPDDHWMFDKVYESTGNPYCDKHGDIQNDDWEYKFDRMNDWLDGFMTALYYKKSLGNFNVEYNF